MGFLARAVAEQKSMTSHDLFREIYGGRTSKAGQTVNLEAAFKQATVFACLKVLSQGCAQVPFKLFQEYQEDGLTKIRPARELPLYDLVTTKPNEWQTSFEFREQLVLHAALGNAYAWKSYVIGGKIKEMILLDPFRMVVEHNDEYAAPVYKYTLRDGRVIPFAADVIWHVRGPSWSGFAGHGHPEHGARGAWPVDCDGRNARQLHAKGVRPSGTYSVDGNLSPQQYKELKAWIVAEMSGADNAGAPMISDRGAKWLATAMTGLDAQHLETRNYQGAKSAASWVCLPSKVGFTDKAATYASAEQFAFSTSLTRWAPGMRASSSRPTSTC
jgi:HK97 family phage portal protein